MTAGARELNEKGGALNLVLVESGMFITNKQLAA
jgi:hypothetical protein